MTKNISSITRGPRQSNIELLRIIAMFLVLIVHADFLVLDAPTYNDFISNPINAWTRTFFESASIVCVNIFILISGWFGIKFTYKGLMNFLFQCIYFICGLYILAVLLGYARWTTTTMVSCLVLLKSNWFVLSYIGLYILAPALNIFIKKASKLQYKKLLILFFLFQTLYGWTGTTKWIMAGYSTFSFIGLYLLAGYVRKYGWKFVTNWGGVIYVATIPIISIIYWFMKKYNIHGDMYAYINPLVILASLGIVLSFHKMDIRHSKIINKIAASSFAVFLLHFDPQFFSIIYKPIINELYNNYQGTTCLFMIFGFLCCVFLMSVIIDQPRRWFWSMLQKKYGHLITETDE